MKWPKLSWNYNLPPKSRQELVRVMLTFGAFFLLGMYFPWQLAVTACAIMSSLTLFSIWLSWSTSRTNDQLNKAILDSIGAIKDCYRMLEDTEWNLRRATKMLEKLGYTFAREPMPKIPTVQEEMLRFHLKRAIAELERNNIPFALLDGEVVRQQEIADAKAKTQEA